MNDEQLRSVILQWVKGHTIQRHVTISGSYRAELMAENETADEILGLFHRRQFEETLAILSALDYINAHGCADDGRIAAAASHGYWTPPHCCEGH